MAHAKSNHNGRKETREANGRGSIYQRQSDGLWVGSLMVGSKLTTNKAGQPIQNPDIRKVYGKTQAEAVRKLDELRGKHAQGLLGSAEIERMTVADFLGRWLAGIKMTVRGRTYDRYAELVRLHLAPHLGRTRLQKLRPDDVQRLYGDKLAAGLSPQSVVHMHRVLHRALRLGVKWGYVARNVCEAVEPPSVTRREMHALSAEEARRLLDGAAAARDRLIALWTLATYTGARLGELLGLKWEDVDWEQSTIAIRRALVSTANAVPEFAEPKTKRSRRTLHLPPEAMREFRAHKRWQNIERLQLGTDYADYGLVFCTRLGTALGQRNVLRWFKEALRRAALPASIRFHDLRHTAATHMLANGVDLPTASAVLGHAQASTTLNIYAHAVPANMAAATMTLQRALRGAHAAN